MYFLGRPREHNTSLVLKEQIGLPTLTEAVLRPLSPCGTPSTLVLSKTKKPLQNNRSSRARVSRENGEGNGETSTTGNTSLPDNYFLAMLLFGFKKYLFV